MINTITVNSKLGTIPKDFEVKLENLTVITGENNVGKTNFINAIVKEKVTFTPDVAVEIVYISADNIKPAENELKSTAKTTSFVDNIAKLFALIGIPLKLDKFADVKNLFQSIESKINENIKLFIPKSVHEVTFNVQEDLDVKSVIQLIVEKIACKEGDESRNLSDLGQGTQRIVIFSVLKAYLDILIEREIHINKSVLIIIDEPEVYLHPKYKRSVNAMLEKISLQPNHQVLIITHDPYFTFDSQNSSINKLVMSFTKDNASGLTNPPNLSVIEGIEDELLHIFLFNKVLVHLRKPPHNFNDKQLKFMLENSKLNKLFEQYGSVKKTYKFINNSQAHEKLMLPLPSYIRNIIHHPDNPFTMSGVNHYNDNDLAQSISTLNKILNN